MALIGISVGETFEYVLDRDPCKKRVGLDVPRLEDAAPTTPPIGAIRTCDLMRQPSPFARTAAPYSARTLPRQPLPATIASFYSPGGISHRGMGA
jgi:hypothetical protein